MLLLLFSSLVVLSNGVPQMALHPQMNLTRGLQPQPMELQKFVANLKGKFDAKTLIEKLVDTDPANVFDDKSLIKELVEADPAKVKEVVALVEAMVQAAQADLDRLTLESTNANSAYDAAVSKYDAAVVTQVKAQAAEEARIVAAVAAEKIRVDARVVAAGLEAQAITDAQSAKDVAEGAKTGAQDNLDAEKTVKEAEIASLKQVISILEGLIPNGGCVASDTELLYGGYSYRTLEPAVIDGTRTTGRTEQSYFPMPAGYEIAPDSDDIATNVIATHFWDIWRVCTYTKCYAGKHYKAHDNFCGSGTMCEKDSRAMWETDNNGNYKISTASAWYRLLIRHKC